jgi:hypothetical protein
MMWDHLPVLILAALVIWLVYRWGALVLSFYALVHLLVGEYLAAGLAFAFASFLTLLRTPLSHFIWNEEERAALRLVRRVIRSRRY